MRIDQELTFKNLIYALFYPLIMISVIIFVIWLFVSEVFVDDPTISQIIGFSVILFSCSIAFLVSLFITNQVLPMSIILKDDELVIEKPRFFIPWKRASKEIPLDSIDRIEHYERRLIVFKDGIPYQTYHIPRLNDENLRKIEEVKRFLRERGIEEKYENELEIVDRKSIKDTDSRGKKGVIKEFTSGTTTVEYLVVNWRAFLLLLLISLSPSVIYLILEWGGHMDVGINEGLFSNSGIFALALSVFIFTIFFLSVFPMFLLSLKKSGLTITEDEILVRAKTNPFLPIIENRFSRASVIRGLSVGERMNQSGGSRYLRGVWRFPPKNALILASIPVKNLFRIDFREKQEVKRASEVSIIGGKVVIERIRTDRIFVDLDPTMQEKFKKIISKR